jgi:hypothetical protein
MIILIIIIIIMMMMMMMMINSYSPSCEGNDIGRYDDSESGSP